MHISAGRASRQVPDQVVAVGDDAIKVIDIDLERRRISLYSSKPMRTTPRSSTRRSTAWPTVTLTEALFPRASMPKPANGLRDSKNARRIELGGADAGTRYAQMEKFAAAGRGRGADVGRRPEPSEKTAGGSLAATPSWRPCGKNTPAALDLAASVHVMLRIGLTGGIGAGVVLSTTFSQCGDRCRRCVGA